MRGEWPDGWTRMKLADVGQWLSGGTPSTANTAYWGGDIPWISAASLKQFCIADSDRRVTPLGADNGSRLVGANTVLFVVRGMSLKSEFRIGVTNREVTFGQDCKAILAADGIDPTFLARSLQSRTPEILAMVEETSHGTGRLDTERLQELEIGVPPEAEQRRIVAAHEVMERRIVALELVQRKLMKLRRSLTSDLVAGPLRSVGELIVGKPSNGFSPVDVPEWTGLLTLGLGCLTPHGFQPRQLKRIPVSEVANRYRLADGDLLMSRANTRDLVGLVGRYEDVGSPCIYPDLMMRLRPDSRRCTPEYLEVVLQSDCVRKELQAGARGTSESMVKVSADVVESLNVPIPSLEEQRRVVEAVAALNARIGSRQSVIDKLRPIQRGAVADLLSGHVGVSLG